MINSRAYCPRCQKPLATCICKLIVEIDNQTEVILWQHPNETNHPKGTAKLLNLCLKNSRIVVGEELSSQQLGIDTNKCLLLFPDTSLKEQTQTEKESPQASNQLLVIDGTWRKSRKIIFCNPWLSTMKRLSIDTTTSNYTIRKSEKTHQLSTFEATAWALKTLEPNNSLKGLNSIFLDFINQQKSYLPNIDN